MRYAIAQRLLGDRSVTWVSRENIVVDGLVVEDRSRVRWLTLDRPDRLNAFTWAMRDRILAALTDRLEDVDALVFTGRGRAFCAGVDLDDVLVAESGAPLDARRAQLERTQEIVTLIQAMPQPVVAAVNGVAAGGGWSLALACNHIIAADSARFVTAFAKLALVPDLAGAFNLTRRVGAVRARSIIMRSQSLDAATAMAIGAVDAVVPGADLRAEVVARLPELVAASAVGSDG
jgi:2-(1,2-epoxy-1,2-dihydrophenyl)acetyl-CoA isomerase